MTAELFRFVEFYNISIDVSTFSIAHLFRHNQRCDIGARLNGLSVKMLLQSETVGAELRDIVGSVGKMMTMMIRLMDPEFKIVCGWRSGTYIPRLVSTRRSDRHLYKP